MYFFLTEIISNIEIEEDCNWHILEMSRMAKFVD